MADTTIDHASKIGSEIRSSAMDLMDSINECCNQAAAICALITATSEQPASHSAWAVERLVERAKGHAKALFKLSMTADITYAALPSKTEVLNELATRISKIGRRKRKTSKRRARRAAP